VLLRDRSTDPGCDGFVRITIGLEEHVTRGLAMLAESLAEIDWVSPVDLTALSVDAGEREYE
jgi:histidinol-phosphate aminotransferase